jgi:hypothetical protein
MNLAKTLTPADQQQQSRPPIPPLIIRKGNNGNGVPDYSHHIQNKSLTKTDIFVVSGKNVENVNKLVSGTTYKLVLTYYIMESYLSLKYFI